MIRFIIRCFFQMILMPLMYLTQSIMVILLL